MKPATGERLCVLAVAALAIGLAVATAGLSPVARRVPQGVLGPVLLLVALELALTFRPALARRLAFLVQADLFADRKRPLAVEVAPPPPPPAGALGPALGWYLLLLALLLVLDVRAALFLHSFAYARLRARESIALSLGLGALVGGLAAAARWVLEGGR